MLAKVSVLFETAKLLILLLNNCSLIIRFLGRNAGTRDERPTIYPFFLGICPYLLHYTKYLPTFANEKTYSAFQVIP